MSSGPHDGKSLKERLMRWQARAGVRLALLQAAVVVVAFGLAGYLAQVSLERISQASIRAHILGEAASLDEEFAHKGADHLPFTVAKRTRLWRGFDYRLSTSGGGLLAGRLPPAHDRLGWDRQDLSPPNAAPRHYLIYTKAMPNGDRLTVGQDTAVEAGAMEAIDRTLLMCGALGVIICLGASYVFTRGTWRRIAAVSTAAHGVSEGNLEIRVQTRAGPPRDDVDELAGAFNGMLDQISLLMWQVRQVSTDIAHDLRTPLTRFGQKLERLKREFAGDHKVSDAVGGLEADVDEILRMFDALLQLSEIQSAEQAPQTKAADLRVVATHVADAYRPDIEESGRTLKVRAESAVVAGDGDLLAQAVANLLENALRHTPKGSRILLTVTPSTEAVELSVEDDGPGIPMEQRERALKPFVRLEPSRNTPGSGLGLAIVAAIAARHQAVLSIENAAPGLRVSLRFALAGEQVRCRRQGKVSLTTS
jgi:signal transduction histidine kinase